MIRNLQTTYRVWREGRYPKEVVAIFFMRFPSRCLRRNKLSINRKIKSTSKLDDCEKSYRPSLSIVQFLSASPNERQMRSWRDLAVVARLNLGKKLGESRSNQCAHEIVKLNFVYHNHHMSRMHISWRDLAKNVKMFAESWRDLTAGERCVTRCLQDVTQCLPWVVRVA